jgi:hypothetical protein
LDQEADENQSCILDLRDKLRNREIELLNFSSSGPPLTLTQISALQGQQAMVTGGGSDMLFGSTKGPGGASQSGGLSQGGAQSQLGAMPKQPGENWIFVFRSDLQKAIDTPHKCRAMTLNECRDSVQQLFESKAAANAKAAKTGSLPVETMEMHVYRVMEKRYGLRSLAAEHTGVLLTSVQRFSSQDNDVLLFMKVFANEVEEEFREVQTELRRSIVDLLRVQLMSR